MLTIQAPAKLNLTLEVLNKRPDGYHEIRSIVQTVSLYDTIEFELSDSIQYSSDLAEWDAQKSLVSKAISLLQKTTENKGGASIRVSKRIPLASGLGGDSSDAAAILLGINRLLDLGLSLKKLHSLAEQLGSDVPFFLYGGTALMAGRGEIITPLPSLKTIPILLIIPDLPRPARKTEQLYTSLKPQYYTDGKITERLADTIRQSRTVTSNSLFNVFENITFAPDSELYKIRAQIMDKGATNVHLAGSGPALFTILESRAEGERLRASLKSPGMSLYVVETVSAPTNQV